MTNRLNAVVRGGTRYGVLFSLWFLGSSGLFATENEKISINDIVDNYANIAEAVYADSYVTAKKLQKEVRKLVSHPTDNQLQLARQAWIASRVPYSQSEVFRFGNPIVDDWEVKVNAWPLDESLIDYVVRDEKKSPVGNIIESTEIRFGRQKISTLDLSADLLEAMHELGDVELNVTTGYHAIEFLLWGQDLVSDAPIAGNRSASDFDTKQCTIGGCFRRGKYLLEVTDLLVKDILWMSKQWIDAGVDEKYTFRNGKDVEIYSMGTARRHLKEYSAKRALLPILRGMGSLAYGELAGERMKLGLLLKDPEEEQDCFSDNTHWSHFYNLRGIENVYMGRYVRIDGSVIDGASLIDFLQENETLLQRLEIAFNLARISLGNIVSAAEQKGIHYDQLISSEDPSKNALILAAVDDLLQLTKLVQLIGEAVGISSIDVLESSVPSKERDYFQ